MAKSLSWKWKLTIVGVVLLIFGMGFVLSSWGCTTMQSWIVKAYDECPPEDRFNHPAADWWLRLAFFEGYICGRKDVANKMYMRFLATLPEEKGKGKRKRKINFFDRVRQGGRAKFIGFYDQKKKTGWGIFHPRAPEAFYEYLELNASWVSQQYRAEMGRDYHKLFHDLYPYYKRTRGKPHPNFYIYWTTIRERYVVKDRRGVPQTRSKPKGYLGPEAL